LCDPDEARLTEAGVRWGVPARYRDLGLMLTEIRPEIVSVASPDETHTEVLDRVLETEGVRAVLAEKPLALDVDQAERLVRKARDRNVVLAVNYVRRYAPSHQQLARWLAAGPIGTIELVRGTYVRGIKHNGTHWLDLARLLVGEIELIRGQGEVAPFAADATIDAELIFAGGARGWLHGLTTAPYSLFEMDLIGTRGRARLIDAGQRFELFGTAASRRFPGFRELVPIAGPAGGLADLLMHAASDLVESLATGREPAATGADAVAALRLASTALEDARERRDVDAALGH
jgi:predicted dehydrogenase